MAIRELVTSLLGAALSVSVALKVWIIVGGHLAETRDVRPLLLQFLSEAGFEAREIRGPGWATVSGASGPCRLVMAKVNADGWHRDVVFKTAPAGSEVVFFYGGQAFADQPKWRTWLDEKVYQLRHAFHGALKADPVIASVVGQTCVVDKQRWAKRLRQILIERRV